MATNDFAGREDFFAAAKRRFKDVPLPGGKSARIRSLTAGEWATLEMGSINKKKGGMDPAGARLSDLRLFAACVCDENGELLFMEADIPKLEAIDSTVILPVVRAIREHSGLRQDVEDAIKNFAATGESDSHTSSSSGQGQQGSMA